jgi:membrane associated rhomboid family serine protease
MAIPEWLGRLPLLSLGLAALWLLVTLVVQLGYASQLQRAGDELHEAASYAIQNPVIEVDERFLPVVRGLMPSFENDSVMGFMRKKQARRSGPTPQERFDQLTAQARATLEGHPFRALGVVPARFSAHGFATHALVHVGWMHLVATLLLFLLVAPLLEQQWGRPALGGVLVLLALVGGGAFSLVHAGGDRALVGGSALVAGLVAAVVVRFRDQEIDFLRWLTPAAEIELCAPAWAIGALWVGYELFLWWAAQGALPSGVDNAVGYAAHAAGAAVGGLLPLALARLGWERRSAPSPAATSGKKKVKAERFDLKKIHEARERGEEDQAFAMLEAEALRNTRNRDAVTSYWQMAVERGVAAQAAPAMLALVQEELRRGAEEVAVAVWSDLVERLPSALLDPSSLLRLAPAIGRVKGSERAVLALEQALDARNQGLTAPMAARVARMALELDPELSVAAARRALASKGLDETRRAELEVLVEELAPPDPTVARESEKPEPSVFYQESDRSSFGEIGDLSALDDSFPDGAVTEAVPRAIETEALQIEVAGSGQSGVAYPRMRAVAVAGVKGLGPKPVLLVDLLVDGAGFDRPLGVIRLRCDRFDPRALVPDADGALDALRDLVQSLLAMSGAKPLPDDQGAAAQPVRVFESLDAYHQQVLRAAGVELA